MKGLILPSVASRLVSFAGTLVAVIFAVALLANAGILLASTSGLVIPGTAMDPYPNADLIVRGSTALRSGRAVGQLSAPRLVPREVADGLRGLPGIADVTGDRALYAQIVGAPPITVEHPWPASGPAGYRLVKGSAPASPSDVVVDQSLATELRLGIGSQVTVQTAAGPASPLRLSGIAASPAATRPPFALFFRDDETAYDLLTVRISPDIRQNSVVASIRAATRGLDLNVQTRSAYDAALASASAIDYSSTAKLLIVMAVIAAVTSVFVVASTFAFSVLQRTREIGLLRATGATPMQIRLLIIGEGFSLSLLAGVVGSALGLGLALVLRGKLADLDLAPKGLALVVSPAAIVPAVAIGVLVTLLSSAVATRRAARIPPIQALRSAAVEPKPVGRFRLGIGIALVALGILFLRVAATMPAPDPLSGFTLVTALTFAAGVALLGPVVSRPVAVVLGAALQTIGGAPGLLSRASSTANARRVASAAAPVMLTVVLAGAVLGMTSAEANRPVGPDEPRVLADFVVQPAGAPGLPLPMTVMASRLPGMRAVSALQPVEVEIPHEQAQVNIVSESAVGVDFAALPDLLDLDVTSGSLPAPTDTATAISDIEAISTDGVGSNLRLIFPDGYQADLRVAAIFHRREGFADILLPIQLVTGHSTDQLVPTILLRTSGLTQNALRPLTAAYPQAGIEPSSVYVSANQAAERAGNADTAKAIGQFLAVFIGLTIVYAAIAIANTLAMATAQRAREFAQLRLLGATSAQVIALVCSEASVILVSGLGVGILVTSAPLAALSLSLKGTVAFDMPWTAMSWVLVGATALALAASIVPAALSLRSSAIRTAGSAE